MLFRSEQDFISGYAMNRLVQGDVGSGKTIVALLALLQNYENNKQGAFMAPTEVLANQLYEEACLWLEPFGVRIALLTGSTTAKTKRCICPAQQKMKHCRPHEHVH